MADASLRHEDGRKKIYVGLGEDLVKELVLIRRALERLALVMDPDYGK